MNLALWLHRNAHIHGQRPAVALGSETHFSYAELAAAATRLAAGLTRLGLRPGDRVGIFMANAPDYVLALWALWWAGLVAVPINARLHGREAAWILEHSGAGACVLDAAHEQELLPHAGPELRVLRDLAALQNPVNEPGAAEVMRHPVARAEDDPAWLFYTSGTTGRPKGVTLTHRNLRWAAMAYVATVQPVEPGDSCLHPAPLSHGSGLYHLAYVMNAGVNVIPVSSTLNEEELFALSTRWPRASFFAAPTIVNRLASYAEMHRPPLQGLASIVYGGAPMYQADFEAARAALGPHLVQIYGQGESPMTITVLPRSVIEDRSHPRHAQRVASVGHAQPMVEISIRSEDGRELPEGEAGEVCVRGDVVMAGYWNQPEATAAAIREGWLWTGDIGRLDQDGFLTLLDRSKDLVISGGNNVYPREVEEVLLQHPAVAEAAVIGRPDAQWGEALVAYVVLRQAVDAQVLDAHCLAHMARYKRPKDYRWVQALPKNNYGKVLKTALREQEASRRAAGSPSVAGGGL
jgi:long-chain acyl-CoA synthetase